MELRKIVFSKTEVQNAVYSHCLHQNKPMPEAIVRDIVIEKRADLVVRLIFDVSAPSNNESVEIGGADVAVALIRYCGRIGVPIPRAAKKAVVPEGDGITMLINLNYQVSAKQEGRSAA